VKVREEETPTKKVAKLALTIRDSKNKLPKIKFECEVNIIEL